MFLPKPLEIERELAIVFEGKEYKASVTKEIQHQVLIENTFLNIIIMV
jgi:hypothetical protein